MTRRAALLYFGVWLLLIVGRYYAANEDNPDLGVFGQSFYTTVHYGWMFYNTSEAGTTFGVNFSPFFYVLAPIYALVPHPLVLHLLVLLSVVAGGLVYPRIVRQMGIEGSLVPFLAMYYFSPPLHAVTYEGFYGCSLVVFPAFLTWLFWQQRKRWAFAAAGLVIMSMRQDVCLVMFGWSLFLLWQAWRGRDRFWLPVALGFLGLVPLYLAFTIMVLQPHWHPWGAAVLRNYESLYAGHDLGGFVESVLTRPGQVLRNVFALQKMQSIAELLLPLGFVPLLRPRALLMVIPYLAIWLLRDPNSAMQTNDHCAAAVLPFLMIAFAEAAAVRQLPLRFLTGLVVACTLFIDQTPVRIGWQRLPVPSPRNAIVWSFMRDIPADASVSTQTCFFPWVCHRAEAYWTYSPAAQYVLVDRGRDQMFRNGDFDKAFAACDVVRSEDSVFLLRRR